MPIKLAKDFTSLIGKMFRYTFVRPLQRFNVEARSKKFLGPDARKFMPAPRAIGPMSVKGKKPIQYPHLESGASVFKSVQQKRLQAMARNKELDAGDNHLTKSSSEQQVKMSAREKKLNDFVIDASNRLQVNKTVVTAKPRQLSSNNDERFIKLESESSNNKLAEISQQNKPARPLPKLSSLPMSNPADIWSVDKTPPGRLSLIQLEEMMINKLSDNEGYWTPEKVAEKYNIKKEYAQTLFKYMKHLKIYVSPRIAHLMDYTNRDNPTYLATKDIIFIVDNSLRDECDRQFDKTFLPSDQLPEEVGRVLELEPEPEAKSHEIKSWDSDLKKEKSIGEIKEDYLKLRRKVEPLRVRSLNKPRPQEREPIKLPLQQQPDNHEISINHHQKLNKQSNETPQERLETSKNETNKQIKRIETTTQSSNIHP